jgi:DNA invertase Pin-like site-specific DNA recombinase
MKCMIYLRVSTDEQVDSKAGLNAQMDSCRAYLNKTGVAIEDHRVFSDEGISGASGLEKRPGMLQAINSLSRGDILLVAKRDRLGRDPIIVAMIESAVSRKGARVVSAAGEGTESDGPSDILMRRLIDAFAEYERLIIRERTASAMQAKKARKERVGAIPYGYSLSDDGIHLEENEAEQMVITQIKELRAAGLNLSAICRELERQGFYTRTGRPFTAEQIKRVLAV